MTKEDIPFGARLRHRSAMYFATIQQLAHTLKNLDTILGKAEKHAETRGFPVDNFMTARIAPDMLAFPKQVQIATDNAKAIAASLAGVEAPKFADDEKTVAELRARIAKTLAFLEAIRPAQLETVSPTTPVKLPYPAGKAMHTEKALLSRTLPNFYFHVTTAYLLLRAGGVEIGKMDYLGQLEMFDA